MKIYDFEAHMYTPQFFNIMEERKDIPFYDTETGLMHHVSASDGAIGMAKLRPKLTDLGAGRIEDMDKNGVAVQLLSCSIGIEQLPAHESTALSQKVHNYIFEATQRYPGRFRGYATLPVNEVEESVKELERCVKELGFIGWNAFSNCNGVGIDDDKYFPIIQKCSELNVPMYIHPAVPFIDRLLGCGPQLFCAGFGFAVDVSISLLRMMCKGVFDKLPDLKVIIGHLGENLPAGLDRLNRKSILFEPVQYPAVNKLRLGEYFKRNIWVTTSGNYSPSALRCAVDVLGVEKVLYGSDYPMETLEDMTEFLAASGLSAYEKERIFHKNAEEMFGMNI